MNIEDQLEILDTDHIYWELGPYDPLLPGPLRLKLTLDGEVIAGCRVETGYLHRGLEKILENQDWRAVISYVDRLDPEAAVFGELATCLAVEEIAGVEPPPRAKGIRVILSELTRVSVHLSYVVKLARAVGSETVIHYILRDREKFLDLFELLTGSRFALRFLCFGGVSTDVSEGFIERVLELCDLIRVRMKEYNDLFSFNHAFLKRTNYIGVAPQRVAKRFGVTGPNLRASGVAYDVRKLEQGLGYEKLDFSVPVGLGEFGIRGDAHDRFLVRLREIDQSLELIRQAADNLSGGQHIEGTLHQDFSIPAGEAYSRVESARGVLGCYVRSTGGSGPARVQFRAPSAPHVAIVPELLVGSQLGDLPVILASLDISVAEVDR